MSEVIESPLTEGQLESAAYLCLHDAAWTDRDQFPPGSGDMLCDRLHAHRSHFLSAMEMVKGGTTSLSELGLSHTDCAWAARQANRAKDQEGWRSSFQSAESELRRAAEDNETEA